MEVSGDGCARVNFDGKKTSSTRPARQDNVEGTSTASGQIGKHNVIKQGVKTELPVENKACASAPTDGLVSSTRASDVESIRKHDERRFSCILCPLKFKRAEHLKRHVRIHTGEKPYQCAVPGCRKIFSRTDNLSAHIKTHKQDEKYFLFELAKQREAELRQKQRDEFFLRQQTEAVMNQSQSYEMSHFSSNSQQSGLEFRDPQFGEFYLPNSPFVPTLPADMIGSSISPNGAHHRIYAASEPSASPTHTFGVYQPRYKYIPHLMDSSPRLPNTHAHSIERSSSDGSNDRALLSLPKFDPTYANYLFPSESSRLVQMVPDSINEQLREIESLLRIDTTLFNAPNTLPTSRSAPP